MARSNTAASPPPAPVEQGQGATDTSHVGEDGRDETVTPSTAVNPDGSIVRDINGAAQSTGSVAIKPLSTPLEGQREERHRLLDQQERYQQMRHKIIGAYKNKG
jgi:hypothetical protein